MEKKNIFATHELLYLSENPEHGALEILAEFEFEGSLYRVYSSFFDEKTISVDNFGRNESFFKTTYIIKHL